MEASITQNLFKLKAGRALVLVGTSPLTLKQLFAKAEVCSGVSCCMQADG